MTILFRMHGSRYTLMKVMYQNNTNVLRYRICYRCEVSKSVADLTEEQLV